MTLLPTFVQENQVDFKRNLTLKSRKGIPNCVIEIESDMNDSEKYKTGAYDRGQ